MINIFSDEKTVKKIDKANEKRKNLFLEPEFAESKTNKNEVIIDVPYIGKLEKKETSKTTVDKQSKIINKLRK